MGCASSKAQDKPCVPVAEKPGETTLLVRGPQAAAKKDVPVDPVVPAGCTAESKPAEVPEVDAPTPANAAGRNEESGSAASVEAPAEPEQKGQKSVAEILCAQGDGLDAEAKIYQEGSVIQISGLTAASDYNGQTATVVIADHEKRCYEVRLDVDGSTKTIMAKNAILISGRAVEATKGTMLESLSAPVYSLLAGTCCNACVRDDDITVVH